MSFPILIDICSDEENEVLDVKEIKPNLVLDTLQGKEIKIANIPLTSSEQVVRQGSLENACPDIVNVICDSRITDYANSFVDERLPNPVSISHGLSSSLCRQFWKAGDYEVKGHPKPLSQDGKNHLRVHPKFLHSNATSHKWVFGAIAELLDNALDEAHNGATFVIVDKMLISPSGSPALVIHDDGGGMDPETMRSCMSFGFSDKKSDLSIGQYGNGFKTSTMRLGADVIVFSRCMSQRTLTQSVGLLSYTFLRQTCCEDVVVPMVDYKLNPKTEIFERFFRHSEKRYFSNLYALLKWSPFASERELLKQFDDIGHHGTKIIIFNLWFTEEGDMELDFESDASDIMISGSPKIMAPRNTGKTLTENHIANRLRYSLREYSSVLYLHMPENFRIILRGQVVEPHQFINDLRFIECIKYKPQIDGRTEIECVTTIGFLEGAPNLSIHGINVYHKNRLILPFWRVVSKTNSKGRGVSGVLEANFIKPTHDKQDFEKSTIYHRLEARLKEMTLEYWDFHCHLVGYPSRKKPRSVPAAPSDQLPSSRRRTDIQSVVQNGGTTPNPSHLLRIVNHASFNGGISGLTSVGEAYQNLVGAHSDSLVGRQVVTSRTQSAAGPFLTNSSASSQTGIQVNLRHDNHTAATESLRRQALVGENVAETGSNYKTQPVRAGGQSEAQDILIVMRENTNLRSECLEFEMRQRELEIKLQELRIELKELEHVYEKLLTESNSIDEVKIEKS